MTDDTDRDPEELMQQSKQQSRYTSEPATATESTDQMPSQTEAIKEALLAVDAGDLPENLNIRDSRLKALLVGLEDAGDLDAVAASLAQQLDADADIGASDATQSDVARLLIRIGLQEGAPDLLDTATDARQQAVLEQTESF